MLASVEEQAKHLALENKKADTDISEVYWFPHESEVRLVELQSSIPLNDEGEIHPFYFQAAPKRDLRWVTAIALIRPEEFKKLKLPETWGEWEKAVRLAGA